MTDVNKLGDMLKALRDPELPKQQEDEIVRKANEFFDKAAKANAWTRFTDGNPTFDLVRAKSGYFDISPINGYGFVNNAAQSIPDITYTALTFNNYTEPSPIIVPTGTNGKFKIASNHSLFGCIGATQWAAGNGIRKLYAYVYDINDTLLYSQELQGIGSYSLDTNILPFANVIWIQPFQNITYIRFYAWQNSGGALTMTYVRIGVFAFY